MEKCIQKNLAFTGKQFFGPDPPKIYSSTELHSLWAVSGCYVMDFFRRSGSWHSALSPVACLCPHATPSVVGKRNRLRNCFHVVVGRLFFRHISFRAWCTACLPKQPCHSEGDGTEQSGLGRSGTALVVLHHNLERPHLLPWDYLLDVKQNVKAGLCVTYFMYHCIDRRYLKKNVKIAEESTYLPVITLILPPFLLQ